MSRPRLQRNSLLFGIVLFLNGCGGGSDETVSPPQSSQAAQTGGLAPASTAAPAQEEVRIQDSRAFALADFAAAGDYEAAAEGSPSFAALGGGVATDRWSGVLNGAAYRIEVPANWNGRLVMYAHGYNGDSPQLSIVMPPIRRYLVENGYAWAASSFSKNGYDVRAGVEDTNALALNFTQIAAERGRPVAEPTRTYIIGHSMGSHIAGAAVEKETLDTALNRVDYHGAVPMCGVMGDSALFEYLAAYQAAAQQLADLGSHPPTGFAEIREDVEDELFRIFNILPRSDGRRLRDIVKTLTGGERPVFERSFLLPEDAGGLTSRVWDSFGTDGTLNGVLTRPILDNSATVYQLDDDPALSPREQEFNAAVPRRAADPEANRARTDGLRWIPRINGQFSVPVVTLHTLGDLFVPFSMQQIYRRRADANGSGDLLVQRAIRAPGHCDFTVTEQQDAFQAMVTWAEGGPKPAGDNVIDPAVVGDSEYGCAFTRGPSPTLDADHPAAFLREITFVPSCS
jgi:hypothetical protein